MAPYAFVPKVKERILQIALIIRNEQFRPFLIMGINGLRNLKMSEILFIRIFQHKIFSSPEQGNILGRHSQLASIVYCISTPKRLDYGYNFRAKWLLTLQARQHHLFLITSYWMCGFLQSSKYYVEKCIRFRNIHGLSDLMPGCRTPHLIVFFPRTVTETRQYLRFISRGIFFISLSTNWIAFL